MRAKAAAYGGTVIRLALVEEVYPRPCTIDGKNPDMEAMSVELVKYMEAWAYVFQSPRAETKCFRAIPVPVSLDSRSYLWIAICCCLPLNLEFCFGLSGNQYRHDSPRMNPGTPSTTNKIFQSGTEEET